MQQREFDPKSVTQAPEQLIKTTFIEAPITEVWKVVAKRIMMPGVMSRALRNLAKQVA